MNKKQSTMNVAVRLPAPLVCVWLPTVEIGTPLVCRWIPAETAPRYSEPAALFPEGEIGGLHLCA
jgi:hypothetical protein